MHFFNSTFWDDNDNIAKGNLGFYLRHLWTREDVNIVDDRAHIESQQGWHTEHRFSELTPGRRADYESFCSSYVYVHLVNKAVAERAFYDIYELATDKPTVCSATRPSLPSCFRTSWREQCAMGDCDEELRLWKRWKTEL